MTILNVHMFVDAVALLSGAPQSQAVHMFDDSRIGREDQGAPSLVSSVVPGQLVRWTVNPIDVQTQVWIKSIAFGPATTASENEEAGDDTSNAVAKEENADAMQSVDEPLGVPRAMDAAPVWGQRFEGYVPYEILPGVPHPYRVDLCFASGSGPAITIEGPALCFVHSSATTAGVVDASGFI